MRDSESEPIVQGEPLVQLLSTTEVAGALHVSRQFVQQLVTANRIPCVRIGKIGSKRPRILFHPDDVAQFIADHRDSREAVTAA